MELEVAVDDQEGVWNCWNLAFNDEVVELFYLFALDVGWFVIDIVHFLEGTLPLSILSLSFLDVLLYGINVRVQDLDLDFLVLELTESILNEKELDLLHLLEWFYDLKEAGELFLLLSAFSLIEAVGYHYGFLFVGEDFSLFDCLLFLLFVLWKNSSLWEHLVGVLRVDHELKSHSFGDFIDEVESY